METTDAQKHEFMADMYETQEWLVKTRRSICQSEELLDAYDKAYLLMYLMKSDPMVTEMVDLTSISNEDARDWWKLGYKRALADMFELFLYKEGEPGAEFVDHYSAMIAEFKKGINE